jgi:hypothetical protein
MAVRPIKCLDFCLCLQISPTKRPVLFSIDGWEWFALNNLQNSNSLQNTKFKDYS